jgi:hypothetical protein
MNTNTVARMVVEVVAAAVGPLPHHPQSIVPLDIEEAIQRARTLARNDQRHRMQRVSLQQILSTP